MEVKVKVRSNEEATCTPRRPRGHRFKYASPLFPIRPNSLKHRLSAVADWQLTLEKSHRDMSRSRFASLCFSLLWLLLISSTRVQPPNNPCRSRSPTSSPLWFFDPFLHTMLTLTRPPQPLAVPCFTLHPSLRYHHPPSPRSTPSGTAPRIFTVHVRHRRPRSPPSLISRPPSSVASTTGRPLIWFRRSLGQSQSWLT